MASNESSWSGLRQDGRILARVHPKPVSLQSYIAPFVCINWMRSSRGNLNWDDVHWLYQLLMSWWTPTSLNQACALLSCHLHILVASGVNTSLACLQSFGHGRQTCVYVVLGCSFNAAAVDAFDVIPSSRFQGFPPAFGNGSVDLDGIRWRGRQNAHGRTLQQDLSLFLACRVFFEIVVARRIYFLGPTRNLPAEHLSQIHSL
jgi:hypothetical protein